MPNKMPKNARSEWQKTWFSRSFRMYLKVSHGVQYRLQNNNLMHDVIECIILKVSLADYKVRLPNPLINGHIYTSLSLLYWWKNTTYVRCFSIYNIEGQSSRLKGQSATSLAERSYIIEYRVLKKSQLPKIPTKCLNACSKLQNSNNKTLKLMYHVLECFILKVSLADYKVRLPNPLLNDHIYTPLSLFYIVYDKSGH